jgi:imidazolonepropionase-like amidohydrolase
MRLLSILALLCVCTNLNAGNLVIHAGRLLAVPGEAPLEEQTILVNGNRIERVVAGYQPAGPGDTLLDLSDQFVMPGLMDMHVHLLVELGPDAALRQLRESAEMAAMRGVANARKTLMAGFTTVRDLGGRPESIFAIRDAIAQDLIPGPRVYAAGSALAATGGHGDVDGMRPELMKMWTPSTICDGAIDCRRATREAIKYGADVVKITATGGVLSDAATGLEAQMTDEEMAEIVRTAERLGRKVAAHAHGTGGINAALKAGVYTVDHGTFLNRESVRLFKQTGAYLVPTMMPGHLVIGQMDGNPFFTDAIKEKAYAAAAQSKAGVAMAIEGGVRIAFGTDSGVTPHGMNGTEFKLMVDAGMTPMAALRSATVVTAEMLGIDNDLGTIEAGKLADIIGVRGDPIADITVMQAVNTVISDGEVEKR